MAHQAHQVPHGDAYSVADSGNRNRGAQAGNIAAHQAEKNQKAGATKSQVDKEQLARLVQEENESKGKLPRYPGLERWRLVEKMGDGAFSNVYKAQDLSAENNVGQVAIKVVRKFEMNSNQVRTESCTQSFSFGFDILPFILQTFANMRGALREMHTFTQILKSSPRASRCAYNLLFEEQPHFLFYPRP